MGGGIVGDQHGGMGSQLHRQQPSETKFSYCGTTLSKMAPAGLPRSEVQALDGLEPFLRSSHPGQAI